MTILVKENQNFIARLNGTDMHGLRIIHPDGHYFHGGVRYTLTKEYKEPVIHERWIVWATGPHHNAPAMLDFSTEKALENWVRDTGLTELHRQKVTYTEK